MFDKDLSFSGRHADRLRKLAPSKIAGEQAGQRLTVFDRYVDVLPIAALVGFYWGRCCEADHEQKVANTNILLEQVNQVRDDLEFEYRLIMLLHDKKHIAREERLNRAFRYDGDEKKRKAGDEVFFGYIRGGIDVLYEKILGDSTSTDEDLQNLYEFLSEFRSMRGRGISMEDILQLCKEASI